jgi:glycosyltransferase involved in cell wall biosynthesis
VEAAKLHNARLGVDVRTFRATPGALQERLRRIRAGEPLRVLNVGTSCLRKGALDYVTLLRRMDRARMQFRFVGPTAHDAAHLLRSVRHLAEFLGKRPQQALPAEYAWGDLFLLPTPEDGYGMVIPQALAGGVPVLTSPHTGAADLIEDGRNGWVLPVRRPDLLLERLRWCHRHRDALAEMVAQAYQTGTGWDWADTARQTEADMLASLAAKRDRAARTPHAV